MRDALGTSNYTLDLIKLHVTDIPLIKKITLLQ